MKEIARNAMSMIFHHSGDSTQQLAEHDFAINTNGVAIQCIKHSKLAPAPMKSVFIELSISILTLQLCKYTLFRSSKFVAYC